MKTDERLHDLVDRWLAAAEAGRPVSVEDLCRDCPELRPALEAEVWLFGQVHRLAPESASVSTVDFGPDSQDANSEGSTGEPIATEPPQVGQEFAGFQIRGVLGKGGFGVVLKAEDTRLRRMVALKVLLPTALSRPEARARFLDEARALAAVQHDHVVPVFQVGEKGGVPYLAMPLLAGETLAARLEREGSLPPAEVLRIGREAAEGLAALHAKGLVHRDVKPANLWLEIGSGRVKVLDLGLACSWAGDGDPPATAGTVAYMSPEQVAGGELDSRSDLFSLGSVLYECATGKRAFGRPTTAETLAAVRSADPTPSRKVNPAVSAGLGEVIERLLRKDPAGRPASAAEVADELELLRASPDREPAESARKLKRWRLAVSVSVVISCGCMSLPLWLLSGVWRPDGSGATGGHGDPGKEPGSSAAAPEPLRVLSLEAIHFATAGPGKVDPQGVLGRESFGAVMDDEFEARARLSRRAFAYLIVFRPDGKDEVLYPQDDADPPAQTDAPVYPSKRRKDRYVMEEGTGLWLVALVASERPLPAYREWRAALPNGPWKPEPGQPDRVWYDDGQFLEVLDKGRAAVRGDRAGRAAADKAPVVGITDWLREAGGGTAAAVAFTVRARQ